jgi:ElaA protein
LDSNRNDAAHRSKPAEVHWQLAAFDQLDAPSLYALLAARIAVFVVEQACAYQELDGLDPAALHLSGKLEDGRLVAVARILPPGTRYDQPSIGRVLTLPSMRGTGLGRVLMQRAIEICRQRWPELPIRLAAQQHLEAFYRSLGFVTISDPYDEDGIEHVDMRRSIRP